MTENNREVVPKSTLTHQGGEDDLRNTTVEERWDLMWQMTVDEWAKKGVNIVNLPMRRDVERLTRLKDQ